MQQSACDRYGFDEGRRAHRLRFLGLSSEHLGSVRKLQEQVIRPNLAAIVEAFYGMLTSERAFWQVVRSPNELNGLRRKQTQYLRTFGVDFDTEGYFETRLRVGLAHARVGVPLWLYHSGFAALSAEIQTRTHGLSDAVELLDVHSRVFALDQSLATEAYHEARVANVARDLRSAESREHAQRTRASRDSLTGLLRRDSTMEALERAVQRSRSDGRPLSVIMADLDFFKRINDDYGHLAGDTVLRAVAERVQSAIRDEDLVGRYGGEELLVVLENADANRAREVAERVRAAVGEAPYPVVDEPVAVTLSQGLAELSPGETAVDVLSRADVALYRAKRDGRDCVRAAQTPVEETG